MADRTIKIPSAGAFVVADSGSYGNEAASPTKMAASDRSPNKRAKIRKMQTLTQLCQPTEIRMDFSEAVRQESLPLAPCDRCGLEYGAASFVLHRQTCGSADDCRREEEEDDGERKESLGREATRRGRGGERGSVRVTTLRPQTLEEMEGVRLSGGGSGGAPCPLCGERFQRHSLRLHVRLCREARAPKLFYCNNSASKPESSTNRASATVGGSHLSNIEIVKDTLDRKLAAADKLTARRVRPAPSRRPRTKSLDRSVLLERGLILPSLDCGRVAQCRACREVMSAERLSQHRQTCKPSPRTVTGGEIVFPSITPRKSPGNIALLPEHTQNSSSKSSRLRKAENPRRPPTVVCYICGREYGTKSISIHEPQCLRKFDIENRKLPVDKRKPLPKKSITHNVPVSLPAQSVLVAGAATVEAYRSEVLQHATDEYFQHCYKEWEKELVPCKKCGRKFAPERHIKHAPRCKAKPLPTTQPPK